MHSSSTSEQRCVTSPQLIERVRTALTDSTGQYRVIDLHPGTYSVTCTLPGFNTVRREGIELTGTFTATVNGEMRIGDLQETITVTYVDICVGKIVRVGRTRANTGVDVFNALNSSAVQNSNTASGPNWLTPTLVMPARFAKVSTQIDF